VKLAALILTASAFASAQIPTRAANGQQILQFNQPPQPTSFDCAVDGSVVNSETGEPIVRAHVTLQSSAGTPSTSTDSSGRWSLSNVACAPAPVLVTRPGFLQRVRGILTLVSGSPQHDVKVELVPQSVFYGKVIDDQGDPVMGAEVAVLVARVAEGRVSFQRSGQANTNDLGEYRIPNLNKGKYILCSYLNNGQPRPNGMMGAETCYPGPVEGGNASAMEVPPGRETRVDFTLRETPVVHVRGTVSGLPEARNIGISMVPRGAGGRLGNPPGGSVREGKFDFRVPPGSYMISADYFEAGKHLLARVPIEVGTSDIDNVTVAVDGGFNITGHVRTDSQSQTSVRSQFGINLRPTEPTTGSGQLKWDADHTSFTFNDMSPGTYRLDIFPPPPFYVKSATLAGQDILSGEFSIAQAAGPIEIVLADDGGSVEGDAVNADGQPVQGGIIALRNGHAAMIQSSGHFKLQNLAPGDYTLYAWDDSNQVEYADQDWMRRYAGSGVAVTVTSGQNSQVKLTQQKVPQ
jgi:hypothetical protein